MKSSIKILSILFLILCQVGLFSQSFLVIIEDNEGLRIDNVVVTYKCGSSFKIGYSSFKGEILFTKCEDKSVSITVKILGYDYIDTLINTSKEADTLLLKLNMVSFELDHVTYIAPSDAQSNKLGFNAKDFLRIAGSFDDPTRLLNKQAAFASTNDQNNAISYRGMPSKFNKWEVNGMEVISPNHLSNAGTRDDVNSPNAGGTNMISGQLINSYQYIKPEDMVSTPNQLSGTSNINTRSGLRPYAQASLIGLEAGTGINYQKSTIDVNYRYSFTGLLSDLGASFGGEEIKFQDLFASYNTSINGLDLKFITITGSSSNDYKAPENITIQKELNDINFKSDNRIFGFNGKKAFQKWVLSFGSYFSDKTFERSATSRNQILESKVFEKTSKLSNSLKLSTKNFTLGLNHVLDNGNLAISKLDTFPEFCFCIQSNLDLRLNIFDVYANKRYNFREKWSIDMTLSYRPFSTSQENFVQSIQLFYPKVMIERLINQSTKINLSIGRNSQNIHDSKKYYNISGNYGVLQLATKYKQNNFSIEAFYHNSLNYFNIFDEGANYFGEAHPYKLDDSKSRTYGISMAQQFKSVNYWIASNASYFNSESQVEEKSNYTPSLNDYNYTLSIQAGKNFKVGDNNLAISLSQIARGGELSSLTLPRLNASELYRAKDFLRLDARITYSRKNSIISLDIQNVLNRQNETYRYFDSVQMKNLFATQLGLIPVLSYRFYFSEKPINL